MDKKSRERFDEWIRETGIDPDNPETDGQKLALSFAACAWSHQQQVIDDMTRRVVRFKAALSAL